MGDTSTLVRKIWDNPAVSGRNQDADEAPVCKVCNGPRSKSGGGICNGCGALITRNKDYNDGPDTGEARVWHAVGKRPSKPEDVDVGQAWLYEPFPGEGSVWIVKKREDGDLGPCLTMKQFSPPTPEQPDEQFARAMLENGEWTFLRHNYGDPEEMEELLKASAVEGGWAVGMVRRGPILTEANTRRNYGLSDGTYSTFIDYKLTRDDRKGSANSYDWRVNNVKDGAGYGANEDWPSVLLDKDGKPVAQGWKVGEWRVIAVARTDKTYPGQILKVKVEAVDAPARGPDTKVQVWVEAAKKSIIISADTASVRVK